jgi:hypothetical protein
MILAACAGLYVRKDSKDTMNAHTAGYDASRSRAAIWTGRILSGIAIAFLMFDAGMKLFAAPAAVEGTTQLGYPASTLLGIGIIQVVCLAIYLVPRTAPIGAVLWTGYLGGSYRYTCACRKPSFQSHFLSDLCRRASLGGTLAA